MTLPPSLKLRQLRQISPSLCGKLDGCILSLALDAGKNEPLLPSNGRALLGEISHKLLELASKKALGEEFSYEALGKKWDELVARKEEALNRSNLDSRFVPLDGIRDYASIKRHTCKQALGVASWFAPQHDSQVSARFGAEVVVQISREIEVKGRIDWVGIVDDEVVIRDFKTGRFVDDDGTVIADYQGQLLIYAAIYAEQFGLWPTTLQIVPLAAPVVEIPYTRDQAAAALQSAVDKAVTQNGKIQESANQPLLLATPTSEICEYCAWKPACPAYWSDHSARRPGDLEGTIDSIESGAFDTKTWRIEELDGSISTIRYLTESMTSSSPYSTGDRVRILGAIQEREQEHQFRGGPQFVACKVEVGVNDIAFKLDLAG